MVIKSRLVFVVLLQDFAGKFIIATAFDLGFTIYRYLFFATINFRKKLKMKSSNFDLIEKLHRVCNPGDYIAIVVLLSETSCNILSRMRFFFYRNQAMKLPHTIFLLVLVIVKRAYMVYRNFIIKDRIAKKFEYLWLK